MIKKAFFLLLLVGLFHSIDNNALAKDITLAWDASPDADVAGYHVYYKVNSSSQPFDGIDAIEGDSPIDVGNKLTTSLTGLPDGQVVYFAVTAYNSEGQDSSYSNVVASEWVPQLYYPGDGSTVSPNEVAFSWGAAPAGTDVTYTLYYGANPTLKPAGLASTTFQSPAMLAGGAFMGLIGLGLASRRRMRHTLLLALLATPLFFYGCGGGGGNDSVPPDLITDGSTVSTDGSRATVEEISGLTDTTYTASNLKPSTKYYWKVVATDAKGNSYESVSGSFVTGKF